MYTGPLKVLALAGIQPTTQEVSVSLAHPVIDQGFFRYCDQSGILFDAMHNK
jgi:hypothetical protein